MTDKANNIQVLVRVRPLNSREKKEDSTVCVEVDDCSRNTIRIGPKSFSFDWVGGQATTQQDIFDSVGLPLVKTCLQGYNCTIFAYGQTGAGKTFTMQGTGLDGNYQDDLMRGLQPRVFDFLFANTIREATEKQAEYLVKCSYFEIYNEQIMDLLNPGAGNLQVREDMKRGIFIEGITEEVVSSAEDTINVLQKGARNRHVGATQMNLESSRSHSVFSMTIESKKVADGVTNVKTSKFNFVDLAGSERQKQTKAEGKRLKEATNINKSLTVLGSVINALVDIAGGKRVHVRYRDSKLTFLLKDSLGGNSKTMMIANISPSSTSFSETLSTLKFAQRAKMIKNKASINEEASGSVETLRKEINRLKAELEASRFMINEFESGIRTSESKKQETVVNGTFNEKNLEEQQRMLMEHNKTQLELEMLLRETLSLLNNSEMRLKNEELRRKGYVQLMRKATALDQNKELQFRMLINLHEEKIRRLSFNSWGQQDEVESNGRQIKFLTEIANSTPVIMEVFQQNLQLREQLDGLDDLKIIQKEQKRNLTLLNEIVHKISDAVHHRKKMSGRFERLCLWKGMTLDQINQAKDHVDELRLDFEKKNQERENMLNLVRRERDQFKRTTENLQKELSSSSQKLEEQERIHAKAMQKMEDRIKNITESFESEKTSSAENNEERQRFQMERIKLTDKIGSLNDMLEAKDTKIGELGTNLKKSRNDLQSKEEELSLKTQKFEGDLKMLQDNLESSRRSEQTMGGVVDSLKNESQALRQKLSVFEEEKSNLVSSIQNLTEQNTNLKRESEKNEVHRQAEIIKLKEESQKARGEIASAISEKDRVKEEMDTLQTSFNFMNDKLNEKKIELTKLQEKVVQMEEWHSKFTEAQKEQKANGLPGTYPPVDTSNSVPIDPSNPESVKQAINENVQLKTLTTELRSKLDENQKVYNNMTVEIENSRQLILNLQNSQRNFQIAYQELQVQYQQLKSKTSGLESLSQQQEKDLQELTQQNQKMSEEHNRATDELNKFNSKADFAGQERSTLEERAKFGEKRVEELQAKLSKKIDEIQNLNERYNNAQIRYFTINQEFENNKQSSNREITMLNKKIVSLTQQNQLFVKLKTELETDKRRLESELADYKMLSENLDATNKMLQNNTFKDQTALKSYMDYYKDKMSNQRQGRSGISGGVSGDNKVMLSKLQQATNLNKQLKTQNEELLVYHKRQLGLIKAEYYKLNNHFKLAQQSYSLKLEEFKKLKEEFQLKITEKNGILTDLKNTRMLNDRIRLDLNIMNQELEKQKQHSLKQNSKILAYEEQINAISIPEGDQDKQENALKKMVVEMKKQKEEIKGLTQKNELSNKRLLDTISRAKTMAGRQNQTFEVEGIPDEQIIDQSTIKTELLQFLNNMRSLQVLSTDCLVNEIKNKEDFEIVMSTVKQMVDELMVKRSSLVKREAQVVHFEMRLSQLKKDVVLLSRRQNVLSGTTKMMASGAVTPRHPMSRQPPSYKQQQQMRMMGHPSNMGMLTKQHSRIPSKAPSRQEMVTPYTNRQGIENISHHVNTKGVYKNPGQLQHRVMDLTDRSTSISSAAQSLRKRGAPEGQSDYNALDASYAEAMRRKRLQQLKR